MVHVESLSSAANNGFQQLWLKIQTRSCKSFLLNTVFRPPSTLVNFLGNLTRVFIDSLLSGRDIFIIGDQVEVYSILFLDVLNEHAPIKRVNESETKPVCHARNHAADENT